MVIYGSTHNNYGGISTNINGNDTTYSITSGRSTCSITNCNNTNTMASPSVINLWFVTGKTFF